MNDDGNSVGGVTDENVTETGVTGEDVTEANGTDEGVTEANGTETGENEPGESDSPPPTCFAEIERMFHAMPLTKYEIPSELAQEWLKIAVADYELDISTNLRYDAENLIFAEKLDNTIVRTLALMIYISYLQRELSRVMALNGVYGKDVQLTGMDATKRVTKQEFDDELERVGQMLHKQKQHCFK